MVTYEQPLDHYLNRLIAAVEAISERLEDVEARIEQHKHIDTMLERLAEGIENLVDAVEGLE